MSEENNTQEPEVTIEDKQIEDIGQGESTDNFIEAMFDGDATESLSADIDEEWPSEEPEEETEATTEEEEEEEDNAQEEPTEEPKKEEDDNTEEKDAKSKENAEDVIEVKINGEVTKVTLSDIKEKHPEVLEWIKSGVSGQKEIQRRFTEVDNYKKDVDKQYNEWQNKAKTVESYLNTFGEKVRDGHVLGALSYFADFAGVPGYLLKEQLFAAMSPEYERRMGMSQEEVNNIRLKEENEYYSQKIESDRKRQEEKQAEAQEHQKAQEEQYKAQEFLDQINQFRETLNITEEEWESTIQELDSELPKTTTITKEMVADRVAQNKEKSISDRAEALIVPVKEFVNDAFKQELKALIKERPDLTEDQLKQVIEDSLKLQDKKKVEEKVKSKSKKDSKPSKKEIEVNNPVRKSELDQYLEDLF